MKPDTVLVALPRDLVAQFAAHPNNTVLGEACREALAIVANWRSPIAPASDESLRKAAQRVIQWAYAPPCNDAIRTAVEPLRDALAAPQEPVASGDVFRELAPGECDEPSSPDQIADEERSALLRLIPEGCRTIALGDDGHEDLEASLALSVGKLAYRYELAKPRETPDQIAAARAEARMEALEDVRRILLDPGEESVACSWILQEINGLINATPPAKVEPVCATCGGSGTIEQTGGPGMIAYSRFACPACKPQVARLDRDRIIADAKVDPAPVTDDDYRDTDGNKVSLERLCRLEPDWAASRIRAMRSAPVTDPTMRFVTGAQALRHYGAPTEGEPAAPLDVGKSIRDQLNAIVDERLAAAPLPAMPEPLAKGAAPVEPIDADGCPPAGPACGHSACSQNFIDTGDAKCIAQEDGS